MAVPGFKEEDILGSTEQALEIYKEGIVKVRGIVDEEKVQASHAEG